MSKKQDLRNDDRVMSHDRVMLDDNDKNDCDDDGHSNSYGGHSFYEKKGDCVDVEYDGWAFSFYLLSSCFTY